MIAVDNKHMKMRVSFFIARYSISGVPLAQIRLAKAFHRRGHQVEIIFGYVPDELVVPLMEGIIVTNLDQSRTYKLLMPIASFLKKNKPDVVFSAEDHLNAIVTIALILARSRAKLSVSSRVNPFDTYPKRLFSKGTVLKQLMRIVMQRADALTCVSKDMVEQYRTIFHRAPHVSVYNIIDDDSIRQRMLEPTEDPWFLHEDGIPTLVAAGRLEPCKGFDTLINAVNELVKIRQVRLMILGDGPSRAELESLIERNGLQHTIRMPGYEMNPLKYFRNADVFVLSSRLEGLPNVLVEAIVCGCTPVATDCPTGPREVLQNGKYGYLVPVDDHLAMAAAINQALDSPISAELLSEAVKPFAEGPVMDRYFKILELNKIFMELRE